MPEETKQCPFCAETIKADAKVCKHCGRDLKKKTSPAKVLLLILGLLFLWFVFDGLFNTPTTSRSARSISPAISVPETQDYVVTYKVVGTGTTSADITIENAQGGTEQKTVSLPWQADFVFVRGDFVYLSAQNNRDKGTITCRILVNATTWKESSSTGAYKIASCSGSVGEE